MKRIVHYAALAWVALALGQAKPALAQSAGAETSASERAPRWDWTADRRRFVEGDIITVLIDESTVASANKSSQALQDRSRRTSLGADYGMSGAGSSASAGVRTGNTGESRERGQTSRSDRLNTEMTVRVVGIEPNGVLRVEGRRKMLIDQHEQEMTLKALLRPEDVSARNIVSSARLAEAEIAYTSNGKLERPKGNIISRLFGWIWP